MSISALPSLQLSPSTATASLPPAPPLSSAGGPSQPQPTPAPSATTSPATSYLSRTLLVLLLNLCTVLLSLSPTRAAPVSLACAAAAVVYSSEVVTDWARASRRAVDKGGVPISAGAGRADGGELGQVCVLVSSVMVVGVVMREVWSQGLW